MRQHTSDTFFFGRRGRDSNPRNPFEFNTLAVCSIRPLWHLSCVRYPTIKTSTPSIPDPKDRGIRGAELGVFVGSRAAHRPHSFESTPIPPRSKLWGILGVPNKTCVFYTRGR